MKKILAFALAALMIVTMIPALAVSAAEEIVISPYSDGIENWSEQTQLLVIAPIPVAEGKAYTWEFTIKEGSNTTTISLKPATTYEKIAGDDHHLFRFQPCVEDTSNRWVPEKGKEYTITAKIYSGETLKYTAAVAADAEKQTWKGVEAFDKAIVPADPKYPATGTLSTTYGVIENYSGATCMIVTWGDGINNGWENLPKVVEKMKNGTYDVKVVITDTSDSNKVYTIGRYGFDHQTVTEKDGEKVYGTPGALEWYGDGTSFIRIIPGDYGINLQKDHKYTVQFVVTEDGAARYTLTSKDGEFVSSNDAFKTDGAIVPNPVPHPTGTAEKDTSNDDNTTGGNTTGGNTTGGNTTGGNTTGGNTTGGNTTGGDKTSPDTGDAVVYATVAMAVALAAMVVITKKVRA